MKMGLFIDITSPTRICIAWSHLTKAKYTNYINLSHYQLNND